MDVEHHDDQLWYDADADAGSKPNTGSNTNADARSNADANAGW